MKAVILAGGKGTRLRPYTFVVPKPLLPVGETPILEVTVRWLYSQGVREIAIALGTGGQLIKAYVDTLIPKFAGTLSIAYIYDEDKPLGTAGPLAQLKEWLFNDDLFVINGDILTQLDLREFQRHHTISENLMTVATKLHTTTLPYGVLQLSDERKSNFRSVSKVTEKPTREDFISAGMYMLSPEALDHIPKGTFYITNLINSLVSRDESVGAYEFFEDWLAIEQFGDFVHVGEDWIRWVNSLHHRNMQQLVDFSRQESSHGSSH